jgi:hypothetical protein
MDKIFAKAVLTIIAAGFTADQGLPGLRPNSRHVTQPYVQVSDKLAIMRTVAHDRRHVLQYSEWNHRGWTYQERYLSRRCLVFTEKQIYWQCQKETWNEENIFEPPRQDGKLLKSALACYDEWENTFEITSKDCMNAIVSQYSMRKFTFPRDALDGLSGILQRVQAITGTLFHWGLPTSRFDQSLAWYGGHKRIKEFRRIVYPDGTVSEALFLSWTWVSYQGTGCQQEANGPVTRGEVRIRTEVLYGVGRR